MDQICFGQTLQDRLRPSWGWKILWLNALYLHRSQGFFFQTLILLFSCFTSLCGCWLWPWRWNACPSWISCCSGHEGHTLRPPCLPRSRSMWPLSFLEDEGEYRFRGAIWFHDCWWLRTFWFLFFLFSRRTDAIQPFASTFHLVLVCSHVCEVRFYPTKPVYFQDVTLVLGVPSPLCVLFYRTSVHMDANSFMQDGAEANVGTHFPGIRYQLPCRSNRTTQECRV